MRRRILILTTFDLDEYVYEALRAGASGFVLKDDPPEQLLAAISTVTGGEACFHLRSPDTWSSSSLGSRILRLRLGSTS